jgi:hypothetical protein
MTIKKRKNDVSTANEEKESKTTLKNNIVSSRPAVIDLIGL